MNSRKSLPALAVLALVWSSAGQAQRLGGAASADVSLVRVFLALLFCLIVATFGVLLIRQRYGGGLPAIFTRMRTNSARIRLAESRRIGPQSDLTLVECDDREYLLLLTPGGPLLLRDRSVGSAGGE